ncbi:MAG: DMT family protein [Planctomycetota bacterium]
MVTFAVPTLLFISSLLMAFAWLGHIRFRQKGFLFALLVSWFIVLPEYLLNIFAIRWGVDTFQPSEMAAMNLSSGVVCVAIVASFFLGERLNAKQVAGFVLLGLGVVLVVL